MDNKAFNFDTDGFSYYHDNYVQHPSKNSTTGTTGKYPYNGKGCKVLKKNIVDGVNLLTSNVINNENTIYVIKYDFVINTDIVIPQSCILKFEGGSISGNYTITGSNTIIEAEPTKILDTTINLNGTWDVAEAYPEWFGAKVYSQWNNAIDSTVAINKTLGIFDNIKLQSGNYKATDTLILRRNTALRGNTGCTTILFAKTDSSANKYMLQVGTQYEYQSEHSLIDGINLCDHSDLENSICTWLGLFIYSSVHIDNSYIGHARNAISTYNGYIDGIRITRCDFFYNGNKTAYPDDPYIVNLNPSLCDNLFMSQVHIPESTMKGVKIANCSGCIECCIFNTKITIHNCKCLDILDLHQEIKLNEPSIEISGSLVSISNSYMWKNNSLNIKIIDGSFANNVLTLKNVIFAYDGTEVGDFDEIESSEGCIIRIDDCFVSHIPSYASIGEFALKAIRVKNNARFNVNNDRFSVHSILCGNNIASNVAGSENADFNLYYSGRSIYLPCRNDEYKENVVVAGLAIADYERKISIGEPSFKEIAKSDDPLGILYTLPKGTYKYIIYKGSSAESLDRYAISTCCSGYRGFDYGTSLDGRSFTSRTAGPIDEYTKVLSYDVINGGKNMRMYTDIAGIPKLYGLFVAGDEFVCVNNPSVTFVYNGVKWVNKYKNSKSIDYSDCYNIPGYSIATNGVVVDKDGSTITPLVYLGTDWQQIKYTPIASNWYAVALYDEDYNFVKAYYGPDVTGTIEKDNTNQNAIYFRGFINSDVSNPTLEIKYDNN